MFEERTGREPPLDTPFGAGDLAIFDLFISDLVIFGLAGLGLVISDLAVSGLAGLDFAISDLIILDFAINTVAVLGPTVPSTGNPMAFWKLPTAASVAGP